MPVNHFLPEVGNDSIGQRTLYGTWLPPGSRVAAYVGPQSDSTDAYVSSSLLVSTLAAGLARCRSGKGDTVVVLPGHTETVSTTTMMDNLVAGTNIVGAAAQGSSLMPTFTFAGTTNTSIWNITKNDVTMANLFFKFNGADSIDSPLIVTGSGFNFLNNRVLMGSDTALDCDVGLTVHTGADNCRILNNYFYTTGTAVNTNSILVDAAVDSLHIGNNRFVCPATSTNGIVQIGSSTVVLTNLRVDNNVLYNKSTGTCTIGFTDAAHTGMCFDNYSGSGGTTAFASFGIILAGTTNILVSFFQNFSQTMHTAKGTSAILEPAAGS